MKDVHVVLGVIAIALNVIAALYGGWCYLRLKAGRGFWRVLRSAQVVVVVEAAFGGVLELTGRKTSSLHILYGVLPLLVSILAESLRASKATTCNPKRPPLPGFTIPPAPF